METETIIIIIGISGLLLFVCLALIPYFRKVYLIGSELIIELIPNGCSSKSKGISIKNADNG